MTTPHPLRGSLSRPESKSVQHAIDDRQQESLAGWLMASPAIVLLMGFLIIPFFLAFVFAFTNQRLISPNPTEFVGLRNFARLLTVQDPDPRSHP